MKPVTVNTIKTTRQSQLLTCLSSKINHSKK